MTLIIIGYDAEMQGEVSVPISFVASKNENMEWFYIVQMCDRTPDQSHRYQCTIQYDTFQCTKDGSDDTVLVEGIYVGGEIECFTNMVTTQSFNGSKPLHQNLRSSYTISKN